MRKTVLLIALVGGLSATQPGCSRNPATGKMQAFLISERDEILLGKEADDEIVQKMSLYTENAEVVSVVEQVGAKMAAASERPDLPWTFRVLDDASVNAFALPGGYVYVTRGLLGHLTSVDELAAVLGHETGHVTARHGAVHLRKTRVASRTIGVFRIVDPNLRHIGGFAASTAGLALLKYSRDDEYQADELSLRYIQRVGYDPKAIPEVFSVLAGVSESSGRVPTWLSTHPEPENRRTRMAAMVGGDGLDMADPAYLKLIDGMVFGVDARDGYFLAERFVQPRMGFQVELPRGWEGQNEGGSVLAVNEAQNALFILGPSQEATGKEAMDAFFADGELARGEAWEGPIGGFNAVTAAFSASLDDGTLMGLIAFVDYGEQVIAMIAVSPQTQWTSVSESMAATFSSFRKTDPKLAAVEPMRIRRVRLETATTLEDFNRSQPSVIALERLALINHVDPGEKLEAGRWVKRVIGFNPKPPKDAAPKKTATPEPAATPQ